CALAVLGSADGAEALIALAGELPAKQAAALARGFATFADPAALPAFERALDNPGVAAQVLPAAARLGSRLAIDRAIAELKQGDADAAALATALAGSRDAAAASALRDLARSGAPAQRALAMSAMCLTRDEACLAIARAAA